MKTITRLLIALALLVPTVAHGQFSTPILYNNQTIITPQYPRWNFVGAVAGDVVCAASNPYITCTFTGGSSTTLQGAYNNGGAGPQVIAEDATRLGVVVRDVAAGTNTIFGVQNSAGTTQYLNIDSDATFLINSGIANSGTNMGTTIRTVNAMGGSTSILALNNAATEVLRFSFDGSIDIAVGNGASWDILPDQQTTLGTAGTITALYGGKGANGSGATAGAAGGISGVQAGAGGDGAAGAAGAGGDLVLLGGDAGAAGGSGANGGAASLDAGAATGAGTAGVLSLGVTNASAIAVGRSGITTTVTGGLTQLTGAVSLTGNGASSFTTSAGAITLTAAAASTWRTSSGALTVDSAAALNLGTTNATSMVYGNGTVDHLFTGDNFQFGVTTRENITAISPAAGGTPSLSAANSNSANVGVNLVPKGTGTIQSNGQVIPSVHTVTVQQAIEYGATALVGGTVTVTFGTAFGATPVCQCTDQTNEPAAAPKCVPSTTQLVINVGSSTDTIAWFCIGQR